MAVGQTETLVGNRTLANQILAGDAGNLRMYFDWIERKHAEYTQNLALLDALYPDAGDQFIVHTFVESLGRLLDVFEGRAPTGTAATLENLAQIVGIV